MTTAFPKMIITDEEIDIILQDDCNTCTNFTTDSIYKLHPNCAKCDIENNKFLGYTKSTPKVENNSKPKKPK